MGLFDRLRGDEEPRVAFFGIDGVPYSLIRDNPGVFENLTEMAEAGSAGPIDSIVPPESSACWPALTTGQNPGRTGVYGFTDREVGSYDTYIPMGRDVQADRVWDRAVEAGRDATVMGVPVTFPPQRNVTRMVSGFLAPGVDRAAHPPAFARELESMGYRIDVDAKLGHAEDKSEFVEDAHATVDARYEAFRRYLQGDDWDLFFGVFMTTDRVNHFLFEDYERDGEYREEFLDFYRKVDRYLGELADLLDDDATMVVASDHGFTSLDYEVHFNEWLAREGWLGYLDCYEVDLNRWLAAEGWLAYDAEEPDGPGDLSAETRAYSPEAGEIRLRVEGRDDGGTVPEADLDEVRAELKAGLESLAGPDGTPVAERVVAEGPKVGGDGDPDLLVVPDARFELSARFEPGDDWLVPADPSGLAHVSDDTRAYSFIPGRFYLNLDGREPRGSVPAGEYEAVRSELAAALGSLAGPDGRPVADRVVTKEEAFHGDHDAIAPDLVVVPSDGFDLKAGFGGYDAVFEANGPRNGMHSFDDATLVVDDPDVAIDDGVDLLDVAPTLLDLLGVEYDPAGFDGRSLA